MAAKTPKEKRLDDKALSLTVENACLRQELAHLKTLVNQSQVAEYMRLLGTTDYERRRADRAEHSLKGYEQRALWMQRLVKKLEYQQDCLIESASRGEVGYMFRKGMGYALRCPDIARSCLHDYEGGVQ